MPPFLAALAAPAIGAGIGFTSQAIKDKWFDGDDETTKGDYAVSGGLGALTGGAGSLGRLLGWNLGKVGLPAAQQIGNSAGWLGKGTGALGMLGNLFDESEPAGQDGSLINNMLGGLSGILTGGGSAGGSASMKDPILRGGMLGGIGQAPTFNKTLADYMSDPQLGNLANQQIITANNAIGRQNRDMRQQMSRDLEANSDAGREALDQIGQIRRENVGQNQAIQSGAQDNQQRVVDEANRLAEEVGSSIISDDHTRHDLQADQARHAQDVAARRAADSRLLEQMATASQDALGTLAGAEAMSTKANAGGIRSKAMDAIQSNRAKAADNWQEKTSILGSLADTALQRDLQAHQLALQSWGQRLDALNSWRAMQMESRTAMNPQMDPSMLNTMMNFAMKPSGYKQSGVGEDGTEWSYEVPTWGTWDPSTSQQYGGMLQNYFGINPFASSNVTLPGG